MYRFVVLVNSTVGQGFNNCINISLFAFELILEVLEANSPPLNSRYWIIYVGHPMSRREIAGQNELLPL